MRTRNTRIDALFAVIPALIFTLCALFVVLIGAKVYENIVARNEESGAEVAALSYVTNKLRQNDVTGAVELRPFGDGDALVLCETVGDSVYETVIYSYDGQICELYAERDSELLPADGEPVLEGEITFRRLSNTLIGAYTKTGQTTIALKAGGWTDEE